MFFPEFSSRIDIDSFHGMACRKNWKGVSGKWVCGCSQLRDQLLSEPRLIFNFFSSTPNQVWGNLPFPPMPTKSRAFTLLSQMDGYSVSSQEWRAVSLGKPECAPLAGQYTVQTETVAGLLPVPRRGAFPVKSGVLSFTTIGSSDSTPLGSPPSSPCFSWAVA